MGDWAQSIKARFEALRPVLDERSRRLWAGAEAKAIGRGGIARVAESTGISRDTVRAGLRAVQAGGGAGRELGGDRLRRPGGGRKTLAERDPELLAALERKLDPEGHAVSGRSVNRMLHELGYSLQANRKTLDGRAAVYTEVLSERSFWYSSLDSLSRRARSNACVIAASRV